MVGIAFSTAADCNGASGAVAVVVIGTGHTVADGLDNVGDGDAHRTQQSQQPDDAHQHQGEGLTKGPAQHKRNGATHNAAAGAQNTLLEEFTHNGDAMGIHCGFIDDQVMNNAEAKHKTDDASDFEGHILPLPM